MSVNSTPDYSNLLTILDRPIAFHRVFVTLTGGVLSGLMLSQALYWHPRSPREGNWFYKTQAEWEDETGMSRYEQEGARKKLLQVISPSGVHVWEEKRAGVPAKLYYRINLEALCECLFPASPSGTGFSNQPAFKNVEFPHSGLLDSSNLERGIPTDKSAVLPRSITEITTETTTEISSEKGNDGLQPSAPLGAAPLDEWNGFLEELCFICQGHKDLEALNKKEVGALRAEGKKILDDGYDIADLRAWMTRHWFKDWRWQKGQQRPKPSEVRSSIPQIDVDDAPHSSYQVPGYTPPPLPAQAGG